MEQKLRETKLDSLVEEVSGSIQSSDDSSNMLFRLQYSYNKFLENFAEFRKKYPLLIYSIKRIIFAILTVYVTIIIVYCLLMFIVTDTTFTMDLDDKFIGSIGGIGSERYKSILSQRKALLGMDKPLLAQILIYLRNVTPFIPKKILSNVGIDVAGNLTGTPVTKWFYLGLTLSRNLGVNARTEVSKVFANAVPLSLIVGASATFFSYLIGIPLGILAARKKEKPTDSAISITSLVLIAIPALVIIKPFFEFSVLFLGGATQWDSMNSFNRIYPIIAVMLLITPGIIIETRRYVVDEMTADYTKFANSKGLSESYVFFVHVFRNSFIRMVRNIPTAFVFTIFGSSILTEQMWQIQGMSYFMVRAVSTTDVFTVLGYVTLSASAGIITTLVGDLLLAKLDPRITLK